MSFVESIRKFVEEDYKDCAILVTCDNQHLFWDNVSSYPDLIWDWENDTLKALDFNTETVNQNQHPIMITETAISLIQYVTAYPNTSEVIDFINKSYTDEKKKEKALSLLQKSLPCIMNPKIS